MLLEATVQGCDQARPLGVSLGAFCRRYQETGHRYLLELLSWKTLACSYRQTFCQHEGKACLELEPEEGR